MPRATKISSGFLLSLGAIGSISSLIRLIYVPGLKNGPDFFQNAINIGVWSVIEPGLGIIAASLATLRPLFKSCMEKTRNSSAASRSTNSKDPSHNSKLSAQRKAIYSGVGFSDRGYLQVQDKPRMMGNFTSVVGDMKSTPVRTYELDSLERINEQREQSGTRESSISESDMNFNEIVTPATIGSLQNKAWFPDDEVLMTRHVDIYDEEAQ